MKNCPLCNKEPIVKDFIECQNNECIDFQFKYLPHEWNALNDDLAALELMKKELK